jgi:uncharacterized BrkB/YihY/UPF0761 family membrane protein
MLYKYLPDAEIAWRDVWLGALVTSLLFAVGQQLLGFYLGRQSFGSTYGAAGSLVVLLVWIYYSAQIFFFGAEFTQIFATRYGRGMEPNRFARFIASREEANPYTASPPEQPAAATTNGSGKPRVQSRGSLGTNLAAWLFGKSRRSTH